MSRVGEGEGRGVALPAAVPVRPRVHAQVVGGIRSGRRGVAGDDDPAGDAAVAHRGAVGQLRPFDT